MSNLFNCNYILLFRSTETKRFRLAPIWPEWNELDINNETWDGSNSSSSTKKKETTTSRIRAETRAANIVSKLIRNSFRSCFNLFLRLHMVLKILMVKLNFLHH